MLVLLFVFVAFVNALDTCLVNGYVTRMEITRTATLATIGVDAVHDSVQLNARFTSSFVVDVVAYAYFGTVPLLADGSPDLAQGQQVRASNGGGQFLTGNRVGKVTFAFLTTCDPTASYLATKACMLFGNSVTADVSATISVDENVQMDLLYNRETAKLDVKQGSFAYFRGVAVKKMKLFVDFDVPALQSLDIIPGTTKVEIVKHFTTTEDLPSTSSSIIGDSLDLQAGQKFIVGCERVGSASLSR